MVPPQSSPTQENGAAEQRSIAELLRQLTEQSTRLAQQEIELAKAEMTVKGKRLGIGAGAFSAAGALALFAFGALTAAAILALASAVEGWLAALIVAGAYLLTAGVLGLVGRTKVRRASPPVPQQAAESVKEDLERTRQKAKEGRE
ncbi:MAG TPA: phage holin family protein [Solirubrobacterales bacterium]|jgi:hypothetical protein